MVIRMLSGLIVTVLLILSTAYSQVTTASILGVVEDESGALLPGVTITVRSLETGFVRTLITDDAGRYRVLSLRPGEYEVSAAMTGFRSEVKSGIKLALGQDLSLNFTLRVGGVVEKVTVISEYSNIEVTGAALSGIVDDKKIRDLPLNARSFIQLSFLQPGVVEFKFASNNINQGRGTKMSVNGLRPTSNSFLLDGTYVNDAIGRTPGSVAGVFLGIETVREFRVLTNSYTAEYGFAAGGVVSAVTKSGANEIHGSGFWFHRNDNLDARNFFDLEKPEFRRHQFGGTIGGPITKEKTFYFGAGEWFRQEKGITRVARVPSLAAREGRLVPVADSVRPYLDLFPIPNGPDLGGGLAEHRFPQDAVANESFSQVRLDHAFSARDLFFGRYTFDDATVVLPAPTPNTLAVVDELSRNQYVTLEYSRIISAQHLNTTRVAFNRTNIKAMNRFLEPVDPSLSFVPGRSVGVLTIGGVGDWGPNRSLPFRRLRNLYSLSNDLVMSGGRHSIKSGLTINRIQDNNLSSAFQDGVYEFATVREFLQGKPNLFRIMTPASITDRAWRQWLCGFYWQYEMKASRDLTFNIGLRYEFTTVLKESHGRVQNLRDVFRDAEMTVGNPMYRNPSLRNWSPRFGFAWDPFGTGRTAIRGGFGMYYDPYLYSQLFPSHQLAAPFAQQAFLRNPMFPRQPLSENLPNRTQSVVLSAFNAENPYSMQYTLSIQRELFADFLLSVSYAGARGVNLMRGGGVNIRIPQIVNGRKFFPEGAPRRNPGWSDIILNRGDGNSWYNSFQLSAQKRFRRGHQFQISYTFSRTIDEGSGVTTGDLTTGVAYPQDADDRKNERGLSAFHAKHNLVFNYTLDLPFMQEQVQPLGRIFGGWQVNGITAIRSGMPFTVGVVSDRARAGFAAAGNLRPDLVASLSKANPILGNDGFKRTGRFYDPFVFALPPPGFLGQLGRNTLIGPDLVNVDFSLVKNTMTKLLGDNGSVQVRIEFFNLFNRTNFSPPDLLVFAGTAVVPDPACTPQFECPLPGAGRISSTTTDARQVQFGLKIIF